MNWLLENIDNIKDYLDFAAYMVAGASIVANKTKTDKDNKAVGIFSKVVNFLAVNLDKLPKKPRNFNQ